ncbi:hypothetical protein [Micromonospora saelicesensis]|uniref:hypothetical protein n=1 Tax=Micromonospora saelicesensis TaxID=285676 RepID=UPI0015EB5019|nr:hypothetical protein [Micromonospora saelicesensis]
MPERPVAGDDAAVGHLPPPELPREPDVGAPDARDVDGADDHKNHDPYQPL